MTWNHLLAEFILTGGEKCDLESLKNIYSSQNLEDIEAEQRAKFTDYPAMLDLLTQVELKVESIVSSMHKFGIYIDTPKLKSLETEYTSHRSKLMTTLSEKLGPINLNSPKQLGQTLVLELGITLPKTKTGQYTTNSEALSKFQDEHQIIKVLLEFRTIDKIINTYITPILSRIDETSRIHPKYDQMSASTGRLASSDPNIQSTPVIGVYGDAIRSVFSAPLGSKLISFDYSQQELRILAHLSGDKELHKAFAEGIDIHKLTASKVLEIPIVQVDKYARNIGKTLNFGIVYGETAYGLSRQLGKSPEECAGILKRYFETYSGVKRYFDNLLTHAKIHGYVETILGRRRGIPGHKIYVQKKFLLASEERIIKNFPIQGSAADMTKLAMCAVWEKVLPKYPQAHMVMQIHDELVFEYEEKGAGDRGQVAGKEKVVIQNFIMEVREAMENALPLSVPVVVDAKVGDNWGEI